MRKVFKLEDLDCANCANKIEREISLLEEVKFVSVSFIMQKLTIEADDDKFDETMKKVEKIIKKVEPDCCLIK